MLYETIFRIVSLSYEWTRHREADRSAGLVSGPKFGPYSLRFFVLHHQVSRHSRGDAPQKRHTATRPFVQRWQRQYGDDDTVKETCDMHQYDDDEVVKRGV